MCVFQSLVIIVKCKQLYKGYKIWILFHNSVCYPVILVKLSSLFLFWCSKIQVRDLILLFFLFVFQIYSGFSSSEWFFCKVFRVFYWFYLLLLCFLSDFVRVVFLHALFLGKHICFLSVLLELFVVAWSVGYLPTIAIFVHSSSVLLTERLGTHQTRLDIFNCWLVIVINCTSPPHVIVYWYFYFPFVLFSSRVDLLSQGSLGTMKKASLARC